MAPAAIDTGDLAAACGFPVPFPACDPGKAVRAIPESDCEGAPDSVLGNGRCDLAPGTYGDLSVLNDAKLTLLGGTYTFCGFQFGRRTETVASAATIVNVHGDVAIGGASVFGPPVGSSCGQIRVNAVGSGEFGFGREGGSINGFFCAPDRSMRLGHGNNLSGRFYALDVSSDSNNRIIGCPPDECVDGQPSGAALRRDIDDYFILAMRHAALKNLSLGSVCNIGVNCGSPNDNSECGTLGTAGITMVDFSQLVGDQTVFRKGGARIWQSFRNNDSPLQNVQLNGPAPNPAAFTPPIIPGTCDANCNPNVTAIKAACGFPTPFPACNPDRAVRASKGEDCGPNDTVPGNQQCDLPPGVYGNFSVQNGGWANLSAGDYVFCNFRTGRRAKVTAQGARILIPEHGHGPDHQRLGARGGLRRSQDPGRRQGLERELRTDRPDGRQGLCTGGQHLAGPRQRPHRAVHRRHGDRRPVQRCAVLRRLPGPSVGTTRAPRRGSPLRRPNLAAEARRGGAAAARMARCRPMRESSHHGPQEATQ